MESPKKERPPQNPSNWEDRKRAPLWILNVVHGKPYIGMGTASQRALLQAGVCKLEDIIDETGQLLQWEN